MWVGESLGNGEHGIDYSAAASLGRWVGGVGGGRFGMGGMGIGVDSVR